MRLYIYSGIQPTGAHTVCGTPHETFGQLGGGGVVCKIFGLIIQKQKGDLHGDTTIVYSLITNITRHKRSNIIYHNRAL